MTYQDEWAGDLRNTIGVVPAPGQRVGCWYGPLGGATTTLLLLANRVYLLPILIGSKRTPAQLGAWVTTGGSTGAVLRYGIYANLNGAPDALVVDLGTVAAETTSATATLTSNVELPAGLHWLAVAGQGGPTIQPTLRATLFGNPAVGMTAISNFGVPGYLANGTVSGALPSTMAGVTQADGATSPAIFAKM